VREDCEECVVLCDVDGDLRRAGVAVESCTVWDLGDVGIGSFELNRTRAGWMRTTRWDYMTQRTRVGLP
jgi:hypothetical protein